MSTVNVTNPEIIYRHIELDTSATIPRQVTAGRLALASILGVSHENCNNLYLLNEAMVHARHPESKQTIFAERESLTSPLDFGVHVVNLISKYPFLRGYPQLAIKQSSNDYRITAKTFDAWVANHLFDNYPHLFGVTKGEAHGFRGVVNSRWARDDILIIQKRPMTFKEFCAKLNVEWDF